MPFSEPVPPVNFHVPCRLRASPPSNTDVPVRFNVNWSEVLVLLVSEPASLLLTPRNIQVNRALSVRRGIASNLHRQRPGAFLLGNARRANWHSRLGVCRAGCLQKVRYFQCRFDRQCPS